MAKELTLDILETYVGKDIGVMATDLFKHVKHGRRNTEAARAVRDLGYSVARNGTIYRGEKKRDAFEILLDSNERPYAKVSGISARGAETGLTALIFPSKYRKEFMISLRSWGKSGLNLFKVKPKRIKVTPTGVRIYVDYIEIIPPKKFLPKLAKWLGELKLPLRDKDEQ